MIKKSLSLALATMATMSTTAFATDDSTQVQPRGIYIRECVGYEPNYTSMNYTQKFLGSVSGDNRQGSSTALHN